MRLGFHYHIPAISKNGIVSLPGYLGRFIDSLAAHCRSVTCFMHSPRPDEIALLDYSIQAPNVSLLDIGPHTSVMSRTLLAGRYVKSVREQRDSLDVMLLRGPSPLLPAMATAVRPVPTALLLVGDYVAGVDDLPQPRWRKEAIRVWSYWNRWSQTRVARRSLTFVNSRVLYESLRDKAPNLYEIRTTTLTKDDFFIRSDTCQSKPYHLLYVGRMDRAKGLLQMVEAVALLTDQGEEVVLTLVGPRERGDPVLEEIQELANSRKITSRIRYLGPRPLGPELFECYQKADIFVIASFAEGFPRTIWEAMANSLPVVATRVGSIPALIEGAAELVSPGKANMLVDAILKLIHNPNVRQSYITRGFALASENTLEAQANIMIQKMRIGLDEI